MHHKTLLLIPFTVGFLASCGGGSGSGDSNVDETVTPANISTDASTDSDTLDATGSEPVVDTVDDPVIDIIDDPVVDIVDDPIVDTVDDPVIVTVDDPEVDVDMSSNPASILGSWQSECRSLDALGTSQRHILAIDDSLIAQDFYEYDLSLIHI